MVAGAIDPYPVKGAVVSEKRLRKQVGSVGEGLVHRRKPSRHWRPISLVELPKRRPADVLDEEPEAVFRFIDGVAVKGWSADLFGRGRQNVTIDVNLAARSVEKR